MRWLTLSVFVVCLSTTIQAHHPERECQRVHPRIDVIGPLGNCLPMSHRRRYNRPTKIGGKIAYYVAPSSQEAMAWHRATHRGHYKNHRPRMETHYFYPKPWEALRIGARLRTTSDDAIAGDMQVEDQLEPQLESGEAPTMIPSEAPITSDHELIEQ